MNIDRIKNISKLDTVTDRPDIRRDVHVFVDYVSGRDVKRAHRDNSLSKTDARRLAKLVSAPDAEAEVREYGSSSWVDFVDEFAHQLGLVHYDTKGEYAGYTSYAPSFPDNFIELDAKAYDKLLSMTLVRQEKALLDSLLQGKQGGDSEFFSGQVLGQLDCFSSFGSATGVVPTLNFTAARRLLLEQLARCPVDEWLSVASLVDYLKQNHPYFLIPKKPKIEDKWSRRKGRYSNFYEREDEWGRGTGINEEDPDAFERVEGRYVERFLEGIPNLLGYVVVAYTKRRPPGLRPTRGMLRAFRVSGRLKRALEGTVAEPVLTITPSFDVYVQSEVYPARIIRDLADVCDLVAEDTTAVFRLDRKKVAAACAADSNLDVVRLLESLASETLPPNVRRELSDWSAHSDKFVLYTGCAVLETKDGEIDIDRFRVENVAKGIDVVRSAGALYKELEKQQLAPLRVKHGDKSFAPLPPKTRSVFPRQKPGKRRREPKAKVTLMRVTRVQLLCPDREFLGRLQRLLADRNCPVETDRKRLCLSYSNQHEKDVSQAIRTLEKEFEVTIDER